MFLARGYAGATIPRIASEAGVAVETIYRAASGKPGLLAAVLESVLAGGMVNAELPVEQRPGIRRVIEEKDPARKLQLYAATQPGVYGRAGALLQVLDEAARVFPSSPSYGKAMRHVGWRACGSWPPSWPSRGACGGTCPRSGPRTYW